MPDFSKVFEFSKNNYVRAALVVLIAAAAAAFAYKPIALRETNPVVQSQDISEITHLAANKSRLEYLLLAKPLSDFPRYVIKYKDSAQIHVVKVPSTSHINLEREVLLKNAIPYAIAQNDYLEAHKGVLADDGDQGGMWSEAGTLLARNAFGIVLLLFIFFAMKKGIPGMSNAPASLIKPEHL